LANQLADIAKDFQRGLRGERENELYWTKAWDSVTGGATALFSALVAEIQRRLGVEDLPQPNPSPLIEQSEAITE
jgi:hypothetical protein